jgi:5-enolpyruvylshikimate-3-phosphate synthase
VTEEVIIEGAEAVAKSYPKFFEDFAKLGGEVYIEH